MSCPFSFLREGYKMSRFKPADIRPWIKEKLALHQLNWGKTRVRVTKGKVEE